MKKLFIISASFFLLVLAFLAVYNFAFKNNSANPIADPKKKEELEKKKSEETSKPLSVAFYQIVPENVFQPVASEVGILYYSERENAIKESSFDGKNQSIRLENIPGTPLRLVWSPNRLGVLMLLKKDGSELWHYGDLRNRTTTPLKKEMSRLVWTSLGDRILYQFTDSTTGERSLNSAMPDGSGWKKLTDLGKEDYFIATVPQSSLIAFWKKTDSSRESVLETINITGENRRTVSTGRYGADFIWSPNSRHLLIQSVTEPGSNSLVLGLTDENGSGYKNLLAPTLASKIVWSKDNETFYYALPGAFPSGTVLPNDYFSKPLYSKDTFWKMNTRTGKKERLVPLEEISQTFDATDLFLAPTETDLYFVDRETKKLYRITL